MATYYGDDFGDRFDADATMADLQAAGRRLDKLRLRARRAFYEGRHKDVIDACAEARHSHRQHDRCLHCGATVAAWPSDETVAYPLSPDGDWFSDIAANIRRVAAVADIGADPWFLKLKPWAQDAVRARVAEVRA